MVTVLALLGVVVVLFAGAALSTREEPLLADAPPDTADLALPDGPMTPADVEALRFSMAPRGYRMSEVDVVLERLGADLADRDRRLAELTASRVPWDAAEAPVADVRGDAAPEAAAPDAPAPDAPAPGPDLPRPR